MLNFIISTELRSVLEALSYTATIIGIPVAIVVFLAQKNKDRIQRGREAYIETDGRYIDYLFMCIEHPELDCFEFSKDDPIIKKSGIDIKKLIAFTILISMLEAGYMLHHGQLTSVHSNQWQSWRDFMVLWARRPDFRKAWAILGRQFDEDFIRYMDGIVRKVEKM